MHSSHLVIAGGKICVRAPKVLLLTRALSPLNRGVNTLRGSTAGAGTRDRDGPCPAATFGDPSDDSNVAVNDVPGLRQGQGFWFPLRCGQGACYRLLPTRLMAVKDPSGSGENLRSPVPDYFSWLPHVGERPEGQPWLDVRQLMWMFVQVSFLRGENRGKPGCEEH